MTKSPEELLALPIGGASVADNIDRAVKSGKLTRREDGMLEIPGHDRPGGTDSCVYVANGPAMECGFLMHFLFLNAYAEFAVPYGCRACYKVKVMPRTLRELVAAWEIAKRLELSSKWGTDNQFSQNVYAGYYYVGGLDMARVVYKIVREAIDDDPKLGPDVPITIKRGCSKYEARLGPSDRYEFAPELAELEEYLRSRFRKGRRAPEKASTLASWIDLAYRIGDETYLDFTGGKRLRPAMLSYDP